MVNESADQIEDVLDADPIDNEPNLDAPNALDERLAKLEETQQLSARQIQQLNAAVGRVQSLAAKFDKTGDPDVEDRVRAALGDVYELLGDVTESIDPAILPESSRARVNAARAAARKVAEDAEVSRKVQEALDKLAPKAPETDPDEQLARVVEARVVSDLKRKGLDPDDAAFDWKHAGTLLKTKGPEAVFDYFDEQAEAAKDGGIRRPRTSPPSAGGGDTNISIDSLITLYAENPAKLSLKQRATVEKYMHDLGVMS